MVRIIIGFPWCVLVVVMMAVFTHGVGGLGVRGNPRTKTIGKSSGVVDIDGGESVAGNDPATAELRTARLARTMQLAREAKRRKLQSNASIMIQKVAVNVLRAYNLSLIL